MEITSEEFFREKIRKKYDITGEILGLSSYTITGTEGLQWAHEYATKLKSSPVIEVKKEMTDFFEPKENKEQWVNLFRDISQILFKGGKARNVVEHLYKSRFIFNPSPQIEENMEETKEVQLIIQRRPDCIGKDSCVGVPIHQVCNKCWNGFLEWKKMEEKE